MMKFGVNYGFPENPPTNNNLEDNAIAKLCEDNSEMQ